MIWILIVVATAAAALAVVWSRAAAFVGRECRPWGFRQKLRAGLLQSLFYSDDYMDSEWHDVGDFRLRSKWFAIGALLFAAIGQFLPAAILNGRNVGAFVAAPLLLLYLWCATGLLHHIAVRVPAGKPRVGWMWERRAGLFLPVSLAASVVSASLALDKELGLALLLGCWVSGWGTVLALVFGCHVRTLRRYGRQGVEFWPSGVASGWHSEFASSDAKAQWVVPRLLLYLSTLCGIALFLTAFLGPPLAYWLSRTLAVQ